jgi:pectate lyase
MRPPTALASLAVLGSLAILAIVPLALPAGASIQRQPPSAASILKTSAGHVTPAPSYVPSPLVGAGLTGFGVGTTGGDLGGVYWVTTLADAGPGSLRYGATLPQPLWIRFAVSGTIALKSKLSIASDKTLDGRGAAVTITSMVVRISGVSNVIVENLRFLDALSDPNANGLRIMAGSRQVWVDHCDFSVTSDEVMSVTQGSTDVTLSWNRFHDNNKGVLVSALSSGLPEQVTMHHNYFYKTYQRNPLVNLADVHAYNNVVADWGDIGMQTTTGGRLLSQGNIFDATGAGKDGIRNQLGNWGIGAASSVGDLFVHQALFVQQGSSQTFVLPYTVVIEPASADLEAQIKGGAGLQTLVPASVTEPPSLALP